jgi:hypothetical protein
VDPALQKDIANRFTYHRPRADQVPRYEALRTHAKAFAELIGDLCPPGRERALALTHLEETVMWANAGISREPDPEELPRG